MQGLAGFLWLLCTRLLWYQLLNHWLISCGGDLYSKCVPERIKVDVWHACFTCCLYPLYFYCLICHNWAEACEVYAFLIYRHHEGIQFIIYMHFKVVFSISDQMIMQEDVEIMKEFNFDAYRFSISWSRIFPSNKYHYVLFISLYSVWTSKLSTFSYKIFPSRWNGSSQLGRCRLLW